MSGRNTFLKILIQFLDPMLLERTESVFVFLWMNVSSYLKLSLSFSSDQSWADLGMPD